MDSNSNASGNALQFSATPGRLAENGAEQTFRNILLQSPNIFLFLKGPQMIIDFANQPLLDSWNKNTSVIGMELLDALPELKDQPFPQLLQDVYQSGKPYYGEEEKAIIWKNGIPTPTYYKFAYQPLFNDVGLVYGIAVMATDVTEQVNSRTRIEESEKRFRALVTATSDIVYRMNADWSEMRELHGRGFLNDTDEAIRDWLPKYIHEKDHKRVLEGIHTAIATKSNFEMEHEVVQKDGSLGWTFSRAVPILNEEGKIVEWFGAASDITARKHAELALKIAREESESRKRLYETITDSTPDLIYVFDLNYRFTYANKALLTMWGMNWERAIGKSLLENGYEPWHAEMHEREIDHVIATRESIRGEVSFPHATLGKRIYDYIFVPVINEMGAVEAVAGTTRDITELKAAEETLKQSGERLEALVAERTSELQRSNEDLQQFAHVASHDLKEPVRKIATFSNRLNTEFSHLLPQKGVDYVEKIEKSAKRIAEMIEGVLRYSTFDDTEKVDEEVNLNNLIENIRTDLEVMIDEKKAILNATELPTIEGSGILLHQLFYNLINNAFKFSKNGIPPVIEISASGLGQSKLKDKLDPAKHYTEIVVRDNGIGFNQSDAEKIFQPFSRLNSRDQYEGTGLGLALCKKIVERHGGLIYADSVSNEGTSFTVVLPLKDE